VLKKWFVLAAAFFMGSVFYFVSADVNLGPALDGGQGGSSRCDSTASKHCYYNQRIPDPDPDTHQAYSGSYATTLEETFGGSSHLMVESCLTQYGWLAENVASCQTTVNQNVFSYAGSLPFSWSDTNEINLGYLDDLNYLSVHIYVNNVYTNTTGTAYGRRVYINNFSVPSNKNVGDNFNIIWWVEYSPWNGAFLLSGPISCSIISNSSVGGSANCTATGSGAAQVEIQASGPGGDGPIMVNEIRSISIAVPLAPSPFNLSGSCSVVNASDNRADLNWSPSANATGYTIQRKGWSGGSWSAIDVTAGTNYSEVVRNDTDFYYRVYAVNSVDSTLSSPAELLVCNAIGGGPICDNDGVLDPGEQCDGGDFGGTTCSTYGYNSGSLSCTGSCTINSAGCFNSGGGTHLECQSNACVSVAGAGANLCTSNVDCGGAIVDDSACIGITAPNSVNAGQIFSATVAMQNTGGTTWDPLAQHKLGSQVGATWGTQRGYLSGLVNPGQSANINFDATAPPSPGIYPFNWKMLKEGAWWFGATCTKTISVTSAPTHLECQSNACVSVAGAGANLCTSNADCAAAPTCSFAGPDGDTVTLAQGTRRAYAYGVSSGVTVLDFITWNDAGTFNKYYTGINEGGGTWHADIILSDLPGPGPYHVDPYMTIPGLPWVQCDSADFTLLATSQTLSTTLTAAPNSGPSPLDVTLTANTSGTATGTTNYSFWWNCADTTTNVATATLSCGALPSPGAGSCSGDSTGFKCQDVINNSYSSNVVWTNLVNVTPSGNSITKTSGGDGAWNAGAVSSQTISSGDGYIEFSTNEIGTHKMAGLNSGGSTGQGYNEIEYAFYMQGGGNTLYIFELGGNACSAGCSTGWTQGTYSPGDILRIAIESGRIKYYKNGSLLHDRAISSTYPYIFDTSLYSQSPDATITNAKITVPANITPVYTYTSSSVAKVIVERGTAPAAQDQETITIIVPAPSVSNATVTVSNSNYCSAGIHATVNWNYSSAGNPPQSNQVAYQVQIDDDSDPLAGNPEWEQSGTTGTSVVTTPCNLANPVTYPQTNCRMDWNVLYRAWVRVQNGYGEWSPWTQMSTYCNGNSCGPATSWTTPAHQLPSPDFSITPPNPQLGISVIFDDIPPTFDGAATFGSWSWNFGDGSVTNGTDPTVPLDIASANHTYIANGNYTVRLTAEDELGISCSNSALISIQKAIPRWREVAPR